MGLQPESADGTYPSGMQRPSYINLIETQFVFESSPSTLAPISNMESLDFCAISESENDVVPSSLFVTHTI